MKALTCPGVFAFHLRRVAIPKHVSVTFVLADSTLTMPGGICDLAKPGRYLFLSTQGDMNLLDDVSWWEPSRGLDFGHQLNANANKDNLKIIENVCKNL